MPKVTLRSPYQTWRGKDQKEGGNVLYPIDGRMVVRPNVIPNNPNSILQSFTRQNFTTVTQAYSNLSDVEAAAWETTAQNYLKTDEDGLSYKPGGKALFTSVNWYRLLDGQAISNVAPQVSGPVTIISNPTLTLNATENQFVFDSSTADGFVILEASPALSGNNRKAREIEYRFVNINTQSDNIQTTVIGAMSVNVSGNDRRFIYQVGDRVGIRINKLTTDYVQQSVQTFEVVVA